MDDNAVPIRRRRRKDTGTLPPASGLHAALTLEWQSIYLPMAAPDSWRSDACLGRYRLVAEAAAELESPGLRRDRHGEILRALAVAASGGDTVAARVVIHSLLHHLVALALGCGLRNVPTHRAPGDVLDDMISTVWELLVTGEALRGERGVWTRLIRDAEYYVLQVPERRLELESRVSRVRGGAPGVPEGSVGVRTYVGRNSETAERVAGEGAGEDPWQDPWRNGGPGVAADIRGRCATAEPSSGEELLEVLRDAADRGLTAADTRLLGEMFLTGVAVAELARRWQVSDRCVRYHRAQAVARLAAVVAGRAA